MDGADIFLGLSGPGTLKPDMLMKMARDPLVLALANPTPEIMPELAMEARPDAMVCTGRSDYPNQVNNVLCFPFLFRGALDVGATAINEEMKLAAVEAIAQLAHEPALEASSTGARNTFGRRLPHPQSVRPAADPAHRAGRGQGRDENRRRQAADRRFRRLPRQAQPLRLPLRPGDEADDRPRRKQTQARRSSPTARTSACCAPRRCCSKKGWSSRS